MIRVMHRADSARLAQIYLNARRKAFDEPKNNKFTMQDFEHDTQDELILVATDGQTVQGFISIYQPTRFIHLLFVDPIFQGGGIGTQLLKAALQTDEGVFELKCLSQNIKALQFYEQLGWSKVVENTANEPYWLLRYHQ
ncbi:GNAT family N-acetyltransferase [Periweissella fabaria]|uniref:N-acetyltransferase domain-containing protein n=1 Tax=Periweissella fabaria TaxID=546157 RepID=A0ABN8BIN6_9LACO|nr:GNAT family N-acetyltransferase [Periweissella fabaria]MCM0597206.1 GNAT family N-acetyltransferase [Periweissella fabaria]CAH0416288.1 hypothetical protein WFA24289_00587 [Periweissella fabaria]